MGWSGSDVRGWTKGDVEAGVLRLITAPEQDEEVVGEVVGELEEMRLARLQIQREQRKQKAEQAKEAERAVKEACCKQECEKITSTLLGMECPRVLLIKVAIYFDDDGVCCEDYVMVELQNPTNLRGHVVAKTSSNGMYARRSFTHTPPFVCCSRLCDFTECGQRSGPRDFSRTENYEPGLLLLQGLPLPQ